MWVGPRGRGHSATQSAHEGAARRAGRDLGSWSGEATGERTVAHSGQGLPGECYRLKEHTPDKLWSSNSRRAKVAAERGGTHRCSEAARRGWPAARKRSGSQSSSTTSGLLGRRHDIGMERGRPWRFGSPRRGGSGGAGELPSTRCPELGDIGRSRTLCRPKRGGCGQRLRGSARHRPGGHCARGRVRRRRGLVGAEARERSARRTRMLKR
jgi:hypothetical protein